LIGMFMPKPSTNAAATPIPISYTTNIFAEVSVVGLAKREGWITNLVNELITTGEFCRVRGHKWMPHVNLTLLHRTTPYEERECINCGTVQSRGMPEWPTP
jgi:hypothetical protein